MRRLPLNPTENLELGAVPRILRFAVITGISKERCKHRGEIGESTSIRPAPPLPPPSKVHEYLGEANHPRETPKTQSNWFSSLLPLTAGGMLSQAFLHCQFFFPSKLGWAVAAATRWAVCRWSPRFSRQRKLFKVRWHVEGTTGRRSSGTPRAEIELNRRQRGHQITPNFVWRFAAECFFLSNRTSKWMVAVKRRRK